MVFLSLPDTGSADASKLRTYFQATLQTCRHGTLALVDGISQTVLQQQAHPDFSPVGWHLGHIAFTESLWILEHLAGQPCPFPSYRTLFAADGLPKSQRQMLPSLDELLIFLADVRRRTLAYLSTAPVVEQARLWHWLIQHECQHSETMSLVMALHQNQGQVTPLRNPVAGPMHETPTGMVHIPAGEVCLGLVADRDGLDGDVAIDNERPAHWVDVAAYSIDRTPVTCEQYQRFMDAGGYQERQWWCDTGWCWLQTAQVNQPLYWPAQDVTAFRHHPVSGVNWYEATAYARFVDKRLPTEAEWALAAQGLTPKLQTLLTTDQINCNHHLGCTSPVGRSDQAVSDYGCYDLLGNVWEWTHSWFRPYPGFEAYPYQGYSAVYFDDGHRVLRGGSWATRPWGLRSSFRNWYEPHVRELFMGFRCVR
ncbi:SUMF1/EgtB/PvdO family nonheme iron enzyme [Adonisia turfae]|uniref:Ergothioneine biosynthesis protein EgtB n=1 Tax=Adonisia turfae CCMR0081 TaxID=2292702 RepID=A0A6M0RS11_9CYAN|nr:SUMF1/EgtB/PvdO family nonheme iron enzyme [Adonisia turfae]NEZ58976.1 ergothioneine biosynthesis protein EgtB [Adonisia turfae CCMR0081]